MSPFDKGKRLYYDERDYAGALVCFESVAPTDPSYATAQRLIGYNIYGRVWSRWADAIPHLENALRAAPDDAKVLEDAGRAFLAVGRIGEGRGLLLRAGTPAAERALQRQVPLGPGDSLEIVPGAAHRVRNVSTEDVTFLVVSAPNTRGDRTDIPTVEIRTESPRQPEIVQLIRALDAYCASLYPAESNHLLDIESLCAPDIQFFVARLDGKALGCGALRVDATGYGEIKRMYVDPAARGRKVGRAILLRIEDAARAARLSCLRLETGVSQPEALHLYRSAGYLEREPFAGYRPDPLSVFMEKTLI